MSEPTGARRYGVGGGDAYYDAVRYGGYEGTREQFGKDQAEFAQNAAAVAEAKETVERDTEEVRNTKNTFENTTVPEAIRALNQEGEDQILAITQKGEEVSQQVETVGTEQKDAVSNEGRARVKAVQDEGDTQVQAVNDAGTAQVGAVNQAGEDQVDAVEQAGADQVQAVTDEGTTQVGAVNRAGSTQVQAVEDKGDEVLYSIPSDYTELVEDVDNLKESITQFASYINIQNVDLWKRNTIGNGTTSQIGTTGKQFETSTTRIAINPILSTEGYVSLKLKPTSGYQYYLYVFNEALTTVVVDSGWQTEENEYNLQSGYFSILIANTSNTAITVNEYTNLEIQAMGIDGRIRNLENEIKNIDAQNVYLETIAFNNKAMFGRYTVGSPQQSTIQFEESTTRIATNPVIKPTAKSYHITPSNGYKYIFYTLTDPTHPNPSYNTQRVWVTEERTYTIQDGINYVLLLIAKTDDSTITTDDFDKVTVISIDDLQDVADDIYSRFDKYPQLLPEYWTTYLETKQQELTNADAALGFNGVSFAFVTDVHINTNNKLSPQLLKYITTHTNLREVVCGGDIITNYNTKVNALKELEWWATNTSELKIVNLHGNHDGNSNNQTDNTQIITDAEFYGLECKQSENYVNFAENSLYGYSDNEHQKVRFIYLDTGAPDSAVINSTQLTWMQSKITELASGWTVVVFAHQFFNPASKTTAELTLDDNGTAILNALNSIYDTVNATIACVVVGHCHRDYSMYSDKGFPVIATTCDTSGTGASTYDPDQPTRESGTITSQAIDLYYISTNAKTIKTIRIGAGDTTKNREFTY